MGKPYPISWPDYPVYVWTALLEIQCDCENPCLSGLSRPPRSGWSSWYSRPHWPSWTSWPTRTPGAPQKQEPPGQSSHPRCPDPGWVTTLHTATYPTQLPYLPPPPHPSILPRPWVSQPVTIYPTVPLPTSNSPIDSNIITSFIDYHWLFQIRHMLYQMMGLCPPKSLGSYKRYH